MLPPPTTSPLLYLNPAHIHPLQGDMLLHLMDAAEPEFALPVGSVPLLQLQSLLESSVRGSSAAADPDARQLAVAFDHRSILNMLIANQQALTAVPGQDGASKTPFSKVGVGPRAEGGPAQQSRARAAAVGPGRMGSCARTCIIQGATGWGWWVKAGAGRGRSEHATLRTRSVVCTGWQDRQLLQQLGLLWHAHARQLPTPHHAPVCAAAPACPSCCRALPCPCSSSRPRRHP